MSSRPHDVSVLQSGPSPDNDQKTIDAAAADSVLENQSTILTPRPSSSRRTSMTLDEKGVPIAKDGKRPSHPWPPNFDIPANGSYVLPRYSFESKKRDVAAEVQSPLWITLPVPFLRTHPGTGEKYLCRNSWECIGKPRDYKINGEPVKQGVGVRRYGGKDAASEMVERERSREMRLCADCYLRRLARRK